MSATFFFCPSILPSLSGEDEEDLEEVECELSRVAEEEEGDDDEEQRRHRVVATLEGARSQEKGCFRLKYSCIEIHTSYESYNILIQSDTSHWRRGFVYKFLERLPSFTAS